MKHIVTFLLVFLASSAIAQDNSTRTADFDWSAPRTLTPAFEPPTSSNRYGEYVGGTVFTAADGVTFSVDDSGVAQQSQRARFLFNYTTNAVELRAYESSTIIIRAAEGRALNTIVFDGPEVDIYYLKLESPGADTTFTPAPDYMRATWTVPAGTTEARFRVDAKRMECSRTSVTTSDKSAVNAIFADESGSAPVWLTLQGLRLPGRPAVPGVYIEKSATKVRRVLIR